MPGMRQVGIIAAGALYALENNLNRISEDHRRAKTLAEKLSKCSLIELNLETVQTNIVVMTLRPPLEVSTYCAKLKERGVLAVPFGAKKIRVVAHLDVDDEDIETAAKIMIETAGDF